MVASVRLCKYYIKQGFKSTMKKYREGTLKGKRSRKKGYDMAHK